MRTLSSANVTDVNLVLKERTHMRLCINMLIFTHNLGNWLIARDSTNIPGSFNMRRSEFKASISCSSSVERATLHQVIYTCRFQNMPERIKMRLGSTIKAKYQTFWPL